MKLFRRRADAAQPINQSVASSPAVPQEIPAELVSAGVKQPFDAIALSAEHQEMLASPVDPRVLRILHEVHADKAAAEALLKSGSVVQDASESWQIVNGPV